MTNRTDGLVSLPVPARPQAASVPSDLIWTLRAEPIAQLRLGEDVTRLRSVATDLGPELPDKSAKVPAVLLMGAPGGWRIFTPMTGPLA